MQKILVIAVLIFLPLNLFSQKLGQGKYWVSFADKSGNGYSLSDPSKFLSQRSLERRVRQNIQLSADDLPVDKAYLDSLENLGMIILGSSKWFNAAVVECYDTLLLDSLGKISFVSEFNFRTNRKKSLRGFETPVKFISQEGYKQEDNFDYGESLPQIKLLNGNSLHELGFQGNGMQIAVIDGGFYRVDTIGAFDSLWNDGRILGYRDFSNAGPDFFNTSSHGMSVLSTMAAIIPGKLVGTAPAASYYLLKSEIVQSETRFEEALWVIAAEFADSVGADIITSSLGYSVFDDPTQDYSYSDMDGKTTLVTRGAEKAFSKGMIVVNSAGNEGNKNWKYITSPSDGPNVLAIGATDTSGILAPFSSRGPSADDRIKPDVVAVGFKSLVVNSSGSVSQGYGTSFSAPQVAGMVACLWEAFPGKTNREIIQAVRRSSDRYYYPDDSFGYGIPDFMTAFYILNTNSREIPAGKLFVIPNPNTGIFDIQAEHIQEGNAFVSIFNQNGKKIYSGSKYFNAGFARINELQGQQAGLYFILAESGGEKYIASVVIL